MRIDLERCRKLAELSCRILATPELEDVSVSFASREEILGPVRAAMGDSAGAMLVVDDGQIMAACDEVSAPAFEFLNPASFFAAQQRFAAIAQAAAETMTLKAAVEQLITHLAAETGEDRAAIEKRLEPRAMAAGIVLNTPASEVEAAGDVPEIRASAARRDTTFDVSASVDEEAYQRRVCGEFYDL